MPHIEEIYKGFKLEIDIYPVGWLRALKDYRSCKRNKLKKHAWVHIRREFAYMKIHVKKKNWRALQNQFNGYLAEPIQWPPGEYPKGHRCGHGWTQNRALWSLRHTISDRNYPLQDI